MSIELVVATLLAENRRLRQELADAQQTIATVEQRVKDLENRLGLDSHNSSKPPSSDGFKRRTRSLRRPSGKRPGGQPGHPGAALQLTDTPDAVICHRPTQCAGCHQSVAEVPGTTIERRQVHEVPPLRLAVTEHQRLVVHCPQCQTLTTGSFPPEVRAPVQYGPRVKALAVYLLQYQLVPYDRTEEVLHDLLDTSLSSGTVATMVQDCAARLIPIEEQLKTALQQSAVLGNDETSVRVAGKRWWTHVACTPLLTHYGVHRQRGRAGMDASGILPHFSGTSIHDGWNPIFAYPCRHALCNAHLLRDLTRVAEQDQQPWAAELFTHMRFMKTTVETAKVTGAVRLPDEERAALIAEYERLVAAGLAANPPPTDGHQKKGRPKRTTAQNLLHRLQRDQGAVLAFLEDFAIPFDNNQAERDLRMVKVQQKIAGTFRSPEGAAAFCRIRSYLSTLRKQGVSLLVALERVFTGHATIPSLSSQFAT